MVFSTSGWYDSTRSRPCWAKPCMSTAPAMALGRATQRQGWKTQKDKGSFLARCMKVHAARGCQLQVHVAESVAERHTRSQRTHDLRAPLELIQWLGTRHPSESLQDACYPHSFLQRFSCACAWRTARASRAVQLHCAKSTLNLNAHCQCTAGALVPCDTGPMGGQGASSQRKPTSEAQDCPKFVSCTNGADTVVAQSNLLLANTGRRSTSSTSAWWRTSSGES